MYSGKHAYFVGPSSNRFTRRDIVRPGANGNSPSSGERRTTRRGFAPYAGNPSPPNGGGERLGIVATPINREHHTLGDGNAAEFIPLNRGFDRFA